MTHRAHPEKTQQKRSLKSEGVKPVYQFLTMQYNCSKVYLLPPTITAETRQHTGLEISSNI